jgi:GTPase
VHDDGTCIGLSEDDLEASIKTLKRIAAELNGHASVIRKFQVPTSILHAQSAGAVNNISDHSL